MTKMTVYSMTDLYTEAKEYAQRLGGEVEYIEIAVPVDGATMVLVHWRNEKGKRCLGSYRLRFIADKVQSKQGESGGLSLRDLRHSPEPI